MNGAAPQIEIFKPFGEAIELTKKILFQPFDFKKWCVIGFAAFLTYLNGGGFPGFHFPGNWVNHASRDKEDFRSFVTGLDPMWWILIGALILVALTIVVVLAWVRARGHFIFIDCIVRNRGAIAQPWNEYRAEGNSYFVFSLLAALVIIGIVVVFVGFLLGGVFLLTYHEHHRLLNTVVLIVMCVGLFLLLILFGTVLQFVAPVMYRRRCKAWAAFVDLIALLGRHLGVFVLYFLFAIVIGIGMAMVMVIAICATCCIALIPYVGTVILLPLFVFMQSFMLLFLRQFGTEYDVWAGAVQIETASESIAPPLPPPIQT